MEVHLARYEPPAAAGIVDFTLNVQLSALRYFDPEVAGCFFSKDAMGLSDETVAMNIRRVWELVGVTPPPNRFTSIAARVVEAKGDSLICYGPAVLVLDPDRIAANTYVLNGDFKNLGYRIQLDGSNEAVCCMRPTEPELASRLNQLARSARNRQRKPSELRLHGSYFEARVTRPIVLDDIRSAYLPPDASGDGLPVSFRTKAVS